MQLRDQHTNTLFDIILKYVKMIITVIFNIPVYYHSNNTNVERLTNDKSLIDAYKKSKRINSTSNKKYIALYFSRLAAWKWYLKHINDNDGQFIYFQSGEDCFTNPKIVNKFVIKHHLSKHFIYFPKGYHILSCDANVKDLLYENIAKSIESN